jgi:hypothetical protein
MTRRASGGRSRVVSMRVGPRGGLKVMRGRGFVSELGDLASKNRHAIHNELTNKNSYLRKDYIPMAKSLYSMSKKKGSGFVSELGDLASKNRHAVHNELTNKDSYLRKDYIPMAKSLYGMMKKK